LLSRDKSKPFAEVVMGMIATVVEIIAGEMKELSES
jgi:hypothetical protein